MATDLTDEQIAAVAARLVNTAGTITAALEALDIDADPNDVEDALVDEGVEACEGCDWWFPSYELLDDESEVVGCDDCRSNDD